ncbi:MAG: TMEM43 family protein [Polyangiales bacterium]
MSASSSGSAALGTLLVCGAIGGMAWNERETSIATYAGARVLAADRVDDGAEGSLVCITGMLETDEQLDDPEFLHAGRRVALRRHVDVFARVEKEREEGEDTVHYFVNEWTPAPGGAPGLPRITWLAARARVGVYGFSPGDVELPGFTELPLDVEMVRLTPGEQAKSRPAFDRERRLFRVAADPATNTLGDLAIWYSAILPGRAVTLFGALRAGRIVPFVAPGGERIHRLVAGSRSEALVALRSEHRGRVWGVRILATMLTWLGLCALLLDGLQLDGWIFFSFFEAVLEQPWRTAGLLCAAMGVVGLLAFVLPVSVILALAIAAAVSGTTFLIRNASPRPRVS